MLKRLLGLETEYAIRYTPPIGGSRPSNELIFRAVNNPPLAFRSAIPLSFTQSALS